MLRENHGMIVFQMRMLREIFETKRNEVTGD
jgi:hypothetical protein